MAITSYGVNDTLTVKTWSKKLCYEILKATPIAPLIGDSSDSCIQLKNEIKKNAGDRVTIGLRTQLQGDGVSEGQTLEGNEESLTTYSDNLLVNELMHAVRVRNEGHSIDAQRVLFNMRDEARMALRDWYAKRMSVSFFNQVCGYTPTTDLRYTGNNTTVAPDTAHRVWSEAGDAGDEDLDSTGDLIKLIHLDYAKEKAQTGTIPVRPLMINGDEKYVVYLHPYQITDLRTDAATAGNWFDIQKAAIQGGQVSKNPIYTGAMGEYNGMIIRSAYDVPYGVNSSTGAAITTVRRGVLLGAQAAVMAFGQGFSDDGTSFKWVEDTFDFQRELGISAQTIWGIKKTRFNSADFGTIVISSYAVAH